jgi:hypothetical protein
MGNASLRRIAPDRFQEEGSRSWNAGKTRSTRGKRMSHSPHSLSSPSSHPRGQSHAPSVRWRRAIFALVTIFSTTLHLVVPLIGAGQPIVPAVVDAVLGSPEEAKAAALPDTSTGLASNQFLTTIHPEENMVVNGSFEMGATALNQTKIPGWTVVTGTVDVWSAYTRPDGSTRILELEGSTPGSISQTLTGLTPSATYFLEFDYGTQGSTGDQASIQVVNSSNAAILNQTITSPNGDPNNLGWMPFRQTFVAPADGVATLRFTSLNTNSIANYGVNIDDVRVAKRLINYVQNGSFENGPVMVNATANAPAWTVSAGNIDVYNAYFRPDGSSRYLNVNGNTRGTISQTVSGLTGNQTYYLDFEYSSEGNISTQAVVSLSNSSATQILSQTVTSPGDANNRGWQHFRTTFIAPVDGIATLQFAGVTAGANGLAVDNVRIADEPLNWVMNGDFESGPAALNIASNAIPGWTVVTGPADIYAPGLYYGKALDLRGSPGSVTLSQTVTGLTAGQVYVFQANYASNGNLDRWGFMRLFDSGGTPLLDQRVACNNDITSRGWCMLRYSFTAPADGIVRIQLADDTTVAGPNNLGINVDNVQISRDVNFIINGSFSSGPAALNQPAVPGWSAVDTPDVVNAWNGSAFGNALDLKGSPGSSNVTQNLFGLTPGQSYTLRYNWAANSDAYSAQFNTEIVANSGTLISVTQSTGLNAAANNAGQRESRHVFTAPADGKVSIIFRDIPDPLNTYYGVIIDNVSVFGTASTAGVLMNVCLVTPPIKTPTASPGGVSGGLVTWVRADAGISASDGSGVSLWTDQSGAGYNLSQATSVNQPLYYSTTITKLVNFNPTLDFDGSSHYLRNRAQLMLSASPYTFLSVGVDDGADLGYRKLFGSEATVDKFGLYRQGGATNDNGWIPYAVGGQSFSTPFLGDRGSMGKGTKYSVAGGPNGYWNGTNFTSDSRTSRAQPQIVGFNSANSAITDRFYTWTDGYKDDPNWSPIRDGLAFRDEFFAQTAIGADINVELWKGRIPEFIAYSQSLTDTDIAKINSYLAVKYGVTLGQGNGAVYSNTNNVNYVASNGTVIWNATANSAYNYNIAGVGRDDASALLQKQSQSVNGTFQPAIGLGAIATTNASNTGTVGTDRSFMMWGDNGAVASFGTSYAPTSFTPAAGYFRLNRVWKVQETGSIGSVQVRGPNKADHLFVSNNAAMTGATEIALTPDGNGNMVASVDFNDGQFFTFGAEATAPGGVNANLTAWYQATQGAESGGVAPANNGSVDAWRDSSLSSNDAFQNTGSLQPAWVADNGKFNFNPSLSFVSSKRLQAQLATSTWNNSDASIYVIYNQQNVNTGWRNLVDFGLTAADSNNPQVGMSDNNRIATWMDGFDRDNTPFVPVPGETRMAGYFWQYNIGGHSYAFDGQPYTGAAGHKIGAPGIDIGNFANIGGDPQLGEYFPGQIAEVVIYSNQQGAPAKQQVQSYLAIKYGITLDISPTNQTASQNYDYTNSAGTTIWAGNGANAGYHNNIAGVGRDDAAGLYQKQSQSVNAGFQPVIGLGAIATTNATNTGTISTDKSFMVWGNNNASATFGTVFTPTSYTPAAGYFRMARVWKVQETGTVGTVEVEGPSTANLLLVSSDPTFATGVTEVALTNSKGTHNFADGQFFTFGAEATAPGGVSVNLVQWHKADEQVFSDVAGTTPATAGGDVMLWKNVTQDAFHPSDTAGGNPTYQAAVAGSNYNPSIFFNKNENDYLKFVGRVMPATSSQSIFFVGRIESFNDDIYTAVSYGDNANDPTLDIDVDGGIPYWDPWLDGSSPANNDTTFPVSNTTTHLLGFTAQNNVTDNLKKRGNGREVASNMELVSTNTENFNNFWIGGDGGGERWNGTVNEIVSYDRVLSGTELSKVESYLAIKWGLTLDADPTNAATNYDYLNSAGATVWAGNTSNSTFHNNIAGIGRDDAEGLEQLQSTSVNGSQVLTLSMGLGTIAANNATNGNTFGADKSYLMWGNNTGAQTLSVSYNAGTNNRIARVWKVQETGTVGTVRVRIPNTVAGLQTIIVNANSAFGSVDRAYALTNSGGFYEADVDFNNNDFFTFSTDPVPTANLIIGKSGPATATQNVNYDYTLVVTNTGVVASSGQISVTDTLPAGVDFVSGSGFLCSASGQLVTCLGTAAIAPNAATTITLTVNPTATGTMNNSASVIGGGDTTSAGSNSVSTLVNPPPADLQISKSAPVTATQNVNFNFTLLVSNTGGSASTGVITVTDALQTGVSFVSGNGTSGFTCSASGQNVTCTSSTAIPISGTATITLAVTPTQTGLVNNTASVIGGGDTTPASSNVALTTVSAAIVPPDLTTTIGQPAPALVAGQASTIPVTVTNAVAAGPTTGPITTTMTLPSGMSAPASFTSNGNTCTTSGQTVTCVNPGPINAGASNTIQVPVTPDNTVVGTTPQFNATSATPGETNTGNNAATPMTPASPVVNGADLTTTIGQPSPALVAGVPSSVPVTITNSGTGPTTGPITTTFTLPANTSAPASFSSNGNTCTTSGQIVTCVNPGPVNAGASNTIQVPVTPDNTTVGTTPVFNAGTATPSETNTGNNAASPMTPASPVVNAADLTTTIGQPAPAFVAGSPSNVPVTVTNNGTGPTTGPITTTFTLPTNTSAPASFSSSGNTCTTSGQTVTCVNPGPINAGSSNTIQVPVTPNNTTISTTPQFNATSATPGETNTGNNAATPMTPSVPVASAASPYDLTTAIGQPSPALVVGQPSTVPVTVTNAGTGPTTGPITTTFTLPNGTSAPASFNSNGNTCTTSGQTVTCVNPGPINNGSSNTIQVPVTPNASVVGTQPQFDATSATPGETNTGNNGATPMVPVSPVVNGADLTTTIGQPSPRLMEGQPSNVPVTVTNSGTGPTTGPITTSFSLPSGTSAPAGFNSNGNACTTTGQTVTCVNPGPINNGLSNTIQVPVTANNGTVGTTPAPFQASAATPGESNTGNNSATPMTPSQSVLSGDVTPPAPPVIVAPAAGISTKDPRPVFSGTVEAGALVTVTEGAATICTTVATGSGNWSCSPTSNLSEGAHTVSVVAQDAAGNVSTPPATRSFTVDTTAPSAPTVTAPAASSTVSDTTPTFSGTAEAGSTVSVTEGAATLCTAVANGSGNWSCDAATPLSDGLHTALVTATDPAGNTSPPATRTFNVDSTAPAAPTLSAPAANASISNTTPTLAGTAEPNSVVTVKDGPTTVCTTTADGAGNWSCTSSTLSAGPHSLTATATDPAGNTGPASAPRALTVDTTAPLAPTLTAPAAGATLGSSTVPVTGVAEPNSTVTVRDGAGGPVVCTTTADGSGNFSCTTTALSNGPHTLAVDARDAAGNTGPATPRSIAVSNTGPAITAPAANAVVSTTTPLFTGVGVPTSTVVVKEGATTLCTTLSDGSGNWACAATAPLAQGAHSVTASVTDSGNNTQVSPPVAFTVDTVAPAAPTVTAPTNNGSTNDSTPTVSGTAEPGSTVRVTDNGNPVCTAVADAGGNWSCDAAAPLSEGPHTLGVTATDPAGNTSPPTTRPFSVDTLPPAAPMVITPTLNSLLNTATPTVAGTAEPNATVQVKDGPGGPVVCTTTASVSGAWSCTLPSPLSQGPHTLSANAVDAAGNLGPNVTVPVTVDSVAPTAPAITQPTNGAVLPGQSPTIAGTAEPGAAIVVKDGPTTVCITTANAGGTWSCQPSAPLSNGAHALTALATDAAGNASPPSTPVSITINTSGNNDDDGDGIPNIVECPGLTNCPDTDGDGVPNYLDTDSDNDGVLDQVEGQNDTDGDGVPNRLESNRADTDGDGIPNQQDADDDGDGIPTLNEDVNSNGNRFDDDRDGDGIPAFLDPNDAAQQANGGDSDGDGISDSTECPGGLSGKPCPDTDGDGVPDYRDADSDNDGLTDQQEGAADADGDGVPNRLESRKTDTDGDGIPNQNDIDDDGDGILTAAEDLNGDGNWGNDDADKDGIPAYLDPNDAQQLPNGGDGDNDGISDKQECPLGSVGGRCPDTDGDGVPDYLDPDSDNDGISDRTEGTTDSDGDGLPNRLESNRADTDGDGVPNQQDADDDGDGVPTAQEDLNTDGNLLNDDADKDGIPAYLDKNDPSPVQPNGGDSDGDGIPDKVECPGGLTGSPCPDSDGDGVPDYRDADSDADGTPDAQEGTADGDGDGIPNRNESSKADTDGDGIPNQQDADDDGDGIPTANEDLNGDGNFLNDDADRDGVPAYLDPNDHQPGAGDADNDGISDKTECVVGPVCADTDGDGRPDYTDPDSDGDGALDAAEGIADGDGDGLPDRLESSRTDTDGDGILNPADADDDGDGIPTKQEDLNGDGNWQNDDADKDGIPAYLDPNDAQKLLSGGDSDGDGIPDKTECNSAGSNRCVDTDGDGRPDYMDADSDGDGTSDAVEGATDTDDDGIPNRLESSKADTDGDGRPNQQDADDDGDDIPTAQEDLNNDGNPLNDDADKDGIPAYLDSNDHKPNQVDGGDADNDGIPDKVECTTGPACPDTDGDGMPDYRDTDSDGDGTTDLREGTADADGDGLPNRLEPNNVDTDGDGTPNNRDADDDGDGVPTSLEDLNGDGNWMDDDPNGNGVPAYLDKNEPSLMPTVAPKIGVPANGGNAPIDGSAPAGSTVTVREGGRVVCTTTANALGQWSCNAPLGVGPHLLTASVTDGSGETRTSAPAFVLIGRAVYAPITIKR